MRKQDILGETNQHEKLLQDLAQDRKWQKYKQDKWNTRQKSWQSFTLNNIINATLLFFPHFHELNSKIEDFSLCTQKAYFSQISSQICLNLLVSTSPLQDNPSTSRV